MCSRSFNEFLCFHQIFVFSFISQSCPDFRSFNGPSCVLVQTFKCLSFCSSLNIHQSILFRFSFVQRTFRSCSDFRVFTFEFSCFHLFFIHRSSQKSCPDFRSFLSRTVQPFVLVQFECCSVTFIHQCSRFSFVFQCFRIFVSFSFRLSFV